jgi:hypothetical protein
MCEKGGVLAFPSHTRASDKIDIQGRGLASSPWASKRWPISLNSTPRIESFLESRVTATPEPPPEGWTLPEAAAALFPEDWSEACFPDDDTAARAQPGIQPTPSPWSQVPLDMIAAVTRAVMAGSAIPAGLETVVEACRSYEAETKQRIAAALVRRAERRAALPGLLAARLAGGAFTARGVSPP